ncbi:hypothetical protein SPBR_04571 [Sporothrix brasiliensis 5110]|uniref:Zn(2)-C6 fungal-type domain-containing protein n=1 Tax=Sporothrix brasiliensis 5110 TaxID=1398154 RepID=A0A0C2F9N1_9PEZI|nr:uncharacterized protein SPBR_04571 [Sporothrix brasiliensis 5110]KIH87798.1 hypothetical protein SPBR_04571 [Sporothrix brasiliensis 5110]
MYRKCRIAHLQRLQKPLHDLLELGRLVRRRIVPALLKDDQLRVLQPPCNLFAERHRRHNVVPPDHDEGGRLDLRETVSHVKLRHVLAKRPVLRGGVVQRPLAAVAFERRRVGGGRLGGLRGRAVRRPVERQNLDNGPLKFGVVLQPPGPEPDLPLHVHPARHTRIRHGARQRCHGRRPPVRPRVPDHQGRQPVAVRQRIVERHEPAVRVAGEHKRLGARPRPQILNVLDPPRMRVRRRQVGRAAAARVVRNHTEVRRQKGKGGLRLAVGQQTRRAVQRNQQRLGRVGDGPAQDLDEQAGAVVHGDLGGGGGGGGSITTSSTQSIAMTAPQVCIRCRKRRIRCDLQFPACKNCRLADVECFFWDNARGQEVPCSYLYLLQQRVAGLKRDLEAVEARKASSAVAAAATATAAVPSPTVDLEGAVALTALADLSQGLQRGRAWSHPARAQGTESNRGYHLLVTPPLEADSVSGISRDGRGLASSLPSSASVVPSHTSYLGPGSTARLAETVLHAAIDRHSVNGGNSLSLPRSLQQKDADGVFQNLPLSLSSHSRNNMFGLGGTTAAGPPPPLSVLHDPRKEAELHALVPLATQRALLEHYSAVVGASSPCYDSLLPAEQEAALLQRAGSGIENPLKWASAHRGTAGAYATTAVFAVATALASRDLCPGACGGEGGRMAMLAMRFRDDVQALVGAEAETMTGLKNVKRMATVKSKRTHENGISTLHSLERTRWTATALATLALCDMIQPTSGQLWDLLGTAISVLADLREGYHLRHRAPEDDADFVRLERTMLRMEARTSLHFRRPSPFCDQYLLGRSSSFSGGSSREWEWQQLLSSSFTPASSVVIDDLVVLRTCMQIRQHLEARPQIPDHLLESLILVPLQVLAAPPLTRTRLADTTATPPMSVQSATVYMTLHPVVVFPDEILKGGQLSTRSRLFQIVAGAACVLLNEYARQNPRHRISSLWMSAERIVEAGIVWVLYVLAHQQYGLLDIGTAMRPILHVSSLLASFAARWKAGTAYVEPWETLVELMWGILG